MKAPEWIKGGARRALWWLPDAWFMRLQFYWRLGQFPNLKQPKTFCEKVQWLKLHDRNPLIPVCANKWSVRSYLRDRDLAHLSVPLLGVYDSADELDFSLFPERYVVKAAHGSGWNVLVRDGAAADEDMIRTEASKWLKSDFSKIGREWAYRDSPRRIVVEQFLDGGDGDPPWDYKIFCFNGEPKWIEVDYGRFTTRALGLYDLNWNLLPVGVEYPRPEQASKRSARLDEMIEIAAKLSSDFTFVRVDLYETDEQVWFGELTFYPEKGMPRFSPRSFDDEMGEMLKLPAGRAGRGSA